MGRRRAVIYCMGKHMARRDTRAKMCTGTAPTPAEALELLHELAACGERRWGRGRGARGAGVGAGGCWWPVPEPPWAGCEGFSVPAVPVGCHSPWSPCRLEAQGTAPSAGSGSAAPRGRAAKERHAPGTGNGTRKKPLRLRMPRGGEREHGEKKEKKKAEGMSERTAKWERNEGRKSSSKQQKEKEEKTKRENKRPREQIEEGGEEINE